MSTSLKFVTVPTKTLATKLNAVDHKRRESFCKSLVDKMLAYPKTPKQQRLLEEVIGRYRKPFAEKQYFRQAAVCLEIFDNWPTKVLGHFQIPSHSEFKYKGSKVSTTPVNKDSYGYIPYFPEAFLRFMFDVMELQDSPAKLKFCDAGCGIGGKVVCAYLLDYRATGIELHPRYFGHAIKLNALSDNLRSSPRIIHGDILKQRYSQYDVVYMYRPFVCRKKQRQLELKVLKELKPGAILVPAACGDSLRPSLLRSLDDEHKLLLEEVNSVRKSIRIFFGYSGIIYQKI